MSTSAREIWDEVLSEMSTRLDELESAIERGDTLPALDFAPPPGLPALPPECADRASSVNERNQQLMTVVSSILAEHPAPPHRMRITHESARPHGASRFDVNA